MKNKILIFFSFLFLMGGNTIHAQHTITYGLNYYCVNLTEANKSTTLAEIRDFCTNRFAIEDMNYVMSEISNLFNDLLIVDVDNDNCNRGYLELTEYEEKFDNPGEDWTTNLVFRWKESASDINFYKAYMDLLSVNLDGDSKTDSDSGAILGVPGSTRGKLFIFNARCDTKQSGYYIVVVDRDVEFQSLPERENRQQEEKELDHVELEVFPNPLEDGLGQLSFYLPENQTATLSIFDVNGQLVQMEFAQKELEKGIHNQVINLNHLTTGMYHIVLQTEKDRVVKKLIKQ